MKNQVEVRWLGINGFEFLYQGQSLLLDPCVTRGDSEKLSDPALVERYIRKADAIFIGHSHWDHLADAPEIIRRTDALLYGSKTTLNICRACGIPEQNLREIHYGDQIQYGTIKVDVIESRHMGSSLPCEGYDQVPPGIITREAMRCGEIFAFLFHFGDLTVLNTGSANFLPETLKGTVCDYFFCGVSKWQQGFPRMCAENVRFGCLVPTHYDQFYDQPLTSFSLRDDFQRFRTELLRILPAAKFREPEILEYITL